MKKILALCMIGCTVLGFAQEVGFLDVTAAVARERRREPKGGTGEGVGGGVGDNAGKAPAKRPLRLTLRSVSATAVDVYFEVEITNESAGSISIPWDPSPRDIEPEDPSVAYQYLVTSLTLWVASQGKAAEFLESTLLFGSAETHTLKILLPGQSVRIRARAKLPAGQRVLGKVFRASLRLNRSTFTPNGPENTRIVMPMLDSNNVAVP